MKYKDFNIVDIGSEIIGNIYESKKYGRYKVLGATDFFKSHHRFYLCEFLDDGVQDLFRKDHIISGEVKNKYKPYIYNVACIGDIKCDQYLYGRWYKMIDRCYNKDSKDYKYYGANGVKVCDRWLCFENYFNDVQNIHGLDYDKLKNAEIELDKDLFGGKIYSPETTRWLPTAINKYMGNQTQIGNLPFIIGIDSNNNKYEFQSQNNFAQIHNLDHECISRCLKNKQRDHNGWRFYYKEEYDSLLLKKEIIELKLILIYIIYDMYPCQNIDNTIHYKKDKNELSCKAFEKLGICKDDITKEELKDIESKLRIEQKYIDDYLN